MTTTIPMLFFISKFLHYFEIDLEDELSKIVKPSHEINNGSLSKMGFIKVGGKWVSKDRKQEGSSSGNLAKDDGDDQATANAGDDEADEHQSEQGDQGNDVPSEACGVGPSIGNVDDRISSMTPFDKLITNHMDSFAYDQRNHHEFCMARLQNLDEQIEAIQNQLFEIQYGKED